MNLQIVLNTPKTPFLNQGTQKELAKFSYPRNSIDLSCHLKSEVPHLCPSLGRKRPLRMKKIKLGNSTLWFQAFPYVPRKRLIDFNCLHVSQIAASAIWSKNFLYSGVTISRIRCNAFSRYVWWYFRPLWYRNTFKDCTECTGICPQWHGPACMVKEFDFWVDDSLLVRFISYSFKKDHNGTLSCIFYLLHIKRKGKEGDHNSKCK